LPTETQLSAPPDFRVRLEKSDALPIPAPTGKIDRSVRAFTVFIPQIPPRTSSMEFSLWTDDQNNKRACQQMLVLEHKSLPLIKSYFAALVESKSIPAEKVPNPDTLFHATAKENSLYQPDSVQSEYGRKSVEFVTPQEREALGLKTEAYTLKPKFSYIFDNEECIAPVFTVEQTGGKTASFASMSADIKSVWLIGFRIPPGGLNALAGTSMAFRPDPNTSYSCKQVNGNK